MPYSLREGMAGLARAKFSTFFTISVICMSLIVIGLYCIFVYNARNLVNQIEERISLEAFVDNSSDSLKTYEIRRQLLSIQGVRGVKYISKEDAANFFKAQFDENIFDILEENPLPASFQVTLMDEYRTTDNVNIIVSYIKGIEGIDDVIYRQDILGFIERYLKLIYIAVLVTAAMLAIGSIFLVSNTIKLIIMSRIQIINTMKLVGATRGFIRRPFIIGGLVQGFMGSLFAVIALYFAMKLINIEIENLITVPNEIYLIVAGTGVFLGFIGSVFAIRRFLKY